jgi:O-antigen/teichoic acid export membrane protein
LSLDHDSRAMTRKVTSGVARTGALQGVALVANIAFTVVLARVLVPADFGVMAGAMIFLSFAQMVSRSGIAPTLVQMQNLTVADLRGGFTLVVVFAVAVFGLLELLAPFAAGFLRLDAIEWVLRALAFVLLFEALGMVAEALLTRRLQYHRVMIVEISGRVIGTGAVGVSLAFLGWGFWALVVAKLTEAAVKCVTLLFIVRPPFAPFLSREILQRLIPMSAGFTLRQLLNVVALNADNVVVGRYFDAASLGLYTRAYHLMSLPSDFYAKVAGRVVFPAMARVQDEPARLKAAFLRGLSLTALLGLPLCAVFFILAQDLVRVLLGGQWLGVVPIVHVSAARCKGQRSAADR